MTPRFSYGISLRFIFLLIPIVLLVIGAIVFLVRQDKQGRKGRGGLVFLIMVPILLLGGLFVFRLGLPIKGITLPIFLLLGVLLIIPIVLLARSGKTGRWILGILGGLILLVGAHLFNVRSVKVVSVIPRDSSRARISDTYDQIHKTIQGYRKDKGRQSLSPIWSAGMEEEFPADVYPSQRAAVRSLGRQMEKSLQGIKEGDGYPRKIWLKNREDGQGLMAELSKSISKKVPGVSFSYSDQIPPLQEGEAAISLKVEKEVSPTVDGPSVTVDSPGATFPRGANVQGGVEVTVSMLDKVSRHQARFVEKAWLDNYSEFVSRYPQANLFLARSQESCTGENEAHEQALQDARILIGDILEKMYRERFGVLKEITTTGVYVTDIQKCGFVVDRFTQSFEGAAGKIWREALLVEVTPKKMEKLARIYTSQKESRFNYWARSLLSLVGMLAGICVVYFVLDIATKGYYTWVLRIAVIGLAGLGVYLLLFMS